MKPTAINSISPEITFKYLSPFSRQIINHLLFATSLQCKSRSERKTYFVQDLLFKCRQSPEEETIARFCHVINVLTLNNDILIGCLERPFTIQLAHSPVHPDSKGPEPSENWIIGFRPLAAITFMQLREKYGPIFCAEGEAPTVYIETYKNVFEL